MQQRGSLSLPFADATAFWFCLLSSIDQKNPDLRFPIASASAADPDREGCEVRTAHALP